jgi:hypothetical protein
MFNAYSSAVDLDIDMFKASYLQSTIQETVSGHIAYLALPLPTQCLVLAKPAHIRKQTSSQFFSFSASYDPIPHFNRDLPTICVT